MKIRTAMIALTLTACFSTGAIALAQKQKAMDPATCPMHAQHMKDAKHSEGVDKRGDEAMGFSHMDNAHHFLMFNDGGAIQVVPKNSEDKDNLQTVRDHLKMIAGMFSAGNFKLPMFIHDTTVPGTQTMIKLKSDISYKYEDVPGGAQVRITTKNPKALQAIYNFMRFQIKDHRTGDPTIISASPIA
jgi:hypothetical protein